MAENEASLLIRIKQVGGDVLNKITDSLKVMSNMAMYVGTALVGFGTLAIHSFKSAEEASNALSQSMVNQGVYTTSLKKKYDEMASALESTTTFADDAITASQAQLQAYLGQTAITKELMQATLDLATAKKIDLKSAADLIGKTIGTETNALQRQGIEIDNTANKNVKLAQVIEQVSAKYGGQSEAAAKGLGALEQLKNSADNFLEVVGGRLAPFVSFFTVQLNDFTNSLKKNRDFLTGLDAVIRAISITFVYAKNGVLGLAEAIGTGLSGALEATSLLMQGKFTAAKDMSLLALDQMKEGAVSRSISMNEELDAINELKIQTDEEKRLKEEALIVASNQRKQDIANTAAVTQFTEEQKAQAKLYGLKLKDKDDIKKLDDLKLKDRDSFLSQVSSLQSAHNSTLAAIGKAAAIAQIAINTGDAAMAGYRWGMTIGGPPLAALFSGLAIAAGAAQTARVAGVQLAEGGVVMPSSGGTQATIGEGGQPEAVIPLDRAGDMGFGSSTTIIFQGPIMGNESQAEEFARAIDRSLLKLRQSNQSVAFETGVI